MSDADDVTVRLLVRAENLPALIEGVSVSAVQLVPTRDVDTYALLVTGMPDDLPLRLTDRAIGQL